jgi:hypothetical protein
VAKKVKIFGSFFGKVAVLKKKIVSKAQNKNQILKLHHGVRHQIKRRKSLALEDYLPIKAQSHPPLCD